MSENMCIVFGISFICFMIKTVVEMDKEMKNIIEFELLDI